MLSECDMKRKFGYKNKKKRDRKRERLGQLLVDIASLFIAIDLFNGDGFSQVAWTVHVTTTKDGDMV